MKVRRYDGRDLHRALSGIVTDQTVCARVARIWRADGLFDTLWANIVGNWAVAHFRKYGTPVGNQLRSLFDEWVAKGKKDEETIRGVEKFLTYCSEQYEQEGPYNTDYLLDLCSRYFNKVRLQEINEQAGEEISRGNLEEAYDLYHSVSAVEFDIGSVIKPPLEYEVWVDAFDRERQRQLISYPGPLDTFLGKQLTLGKLFSFMGPDKTGKTMWLLDAAYRAIESRCRVAYFDVGDMNKEDILLRLGERASRRSASKTKWEVPKTVDSEGEITSEERITDKVLSVREAWKEFGRVCRGRDCLRISFHANNSIDVDGISSLLMDWGRTGWVPDVVIIDYADILAAPKGVREAIDQVDVTWKNLRRLSQEHHCLVLTATQSNAAAYSEKRGMLTKKHFSGRKTKLAHVNGMIGLNVTAEDKEKGVTRINWVVKREGAYSERKAIVVAGCFDVCNPAVRSSK